MAELLAKLSILFSHTPSVASCNCLGEMLSRLLRLLPLTNFAPTWRAAKKRGRRINNFAIGAQGCGQEGVVLWGGG